MPRTSPIGINGVSLSWVTGPTGKVHQVLVKARDQTGTYQGKRFPVVSFKRDGTPNLPLEAKAWAETTRAGFMAGKAVAGTCDVAEMGKAYCTAIRAADCEEGYARNIEQTVEALAAAGIRDMKAPDFGDRVHAWLAKLEANWQVGGEDFKFRRKKVRELSNTYRNRLLRQLRTVATYAMSRRRLVADPFLGIKRFKEEKKLKALFTLDEMREMVSDKHRKRAWWLPACIMIYTGCRVQEAMHLRWEWIDWESGGIELKLRPEFQIKGWKERRVMLLPELAAILKPLRPKGNAHGWIITDEYLRSNGTAKRKRARTKSVKPDYTPGFRVYLDDIGIEAGKRTAHSTRHGWITLMLAMNMDEGRVMRAAGHEEYSTTLGYSQQTDKYAQQVASWPQGDFFLRREPPKAKASA